MNSSTKLSSATLIALCVTLGMGQAVKADIPLNEAPKPIRPVLEGVSFCNGTYTASFGYKNDNTDTVEIPVGLSNRFASESQNKGQITTFLSGRVRNAFTVDFDGNNLVWVLNTPLGGTRTSTASSLKAVSCGV